MSPCPIGAGTPIGTSRWYKHLHVTANCSRATILLYRFASLITSFGNLRYEDWRVDQGLSDCMQYSIDSYLDTGLQDALTCSVSKVLLVVPFVS
ncbi:MAG: hypothetical protein H6Q72_3249 [Firmicutes bacterium]|nr:hypothetical protein [Bacillota bacterium]